MKRNHIKASGKMGAQGTRKAMSVIEQHEAPVANAEVWGSDQIAGLLRSLDFEYIALTPGASFRGLHDSLVNYLGNTRPELLLCVHEEHAVAIAHGYTRVTGKPMAVALHSNVGLMHATMAIFNAWCDRVPMVILGAVGPMDAMQRRPWVDWIHTARDLGALVRGYTKWDDLPGSVPAAIESILRAHQIATTYPRGPVFVCLDAALQEQLSQPAESPVPLHRFQAPVAGDPPAETVTQIAAALAKAKRPLILIGRVSTDLQDWNRRVQLAERLNARVLTDLKTGASFPTGHPLHTYPPGLFVTAEAGQSVTEADVILSLDWIDLGGSLRQACGGNWPNATVIQCSLDQYTHNGWSMDYQALPPAEISVLAMPDRLVGLLLEKIEPKSATNWAPHRPTPEIKAVTDGKKILSIDILAKLTIERLAPYKPSYIRLPLGWPGECCKFENALDYIGFDGGGGIGSGPGMAVGAAMALRGSRRLPVAILGDGDYLMGLTAIWTAANNRVPLLILVANNQSFFNDELHQERVARVRGRPIENRSVGLRMSDPPFNLALLAEGQGAKGFGPINTESELEAAISDACAQVLAGATCVIDVRVAPEYARAMSSSLLRQIPATK
jgi:thiamine pyrophosphate-dependent acetolactate synthase large subunit-like protein